jgi:r-opsin
MKKEIQSYHLFHAQCLKELYPWLCIVVETKKSSSKQHGGDDQSTNSTKTEASATTQG